MDSSLRWLIYLMMAGSCWAHSNQAKSRQKRLLWITNDGRLALPPGTLLTITPTISMPFVRYPPDGFLSNMTISLPFTINFDVLGLTDNQNPYGVLPPILARSIGRSAGAFLADYVASVINNRRTTRSVDQKVPSEITSLFHGGERALLYTMIEDFLSNFGLDGKACLLRAICEVNGQSMKHFGFLGEILKLFLTASRSPYSNLLKDYVKAEKLGREHGECFPYFKKCSKSLFLSAEKNKYMIEEPEEHLTEEVEAEEEEPKAESEEDKSEVFMPNNVIQNIVM